MRRAAVFVAVLCILGACSTSAASPTTAPATVVPGQPAPIGLPTSTGPVHSLCPLTGPVHCDAAALGTAAGLAQRFAAPFGYGPADLAAAYGLTSLTAKLGDSQTIGIVTVFDNPNLEADLATYRSTFGLPACTRASGCLRIVDELGLPETSIPAIAAQANATVKLLGQDAFDIGGELSLDVDMVSASCPRCHILVVEAFTEGASVPVVAVSLKDLAQAANTAARLGAHTVSTSYGGIDGVDPTQPADDALYNTAGAVQLASSGDGGYGVEFPAASPHVVAVGGTHLARAPGTGRQFAETAWNLAGSGCSADEAKPAWQRDPLCPNRTVSDVSADADPSTPVAVYDTFGAAKGDGGWLAVGGTSASSPFVAGIIGLAGNGATLATGGSGAGYLYAHASTFRDVQGSVNKKGCGDYTCRGDVGYDGPTGLGSPNGIAGL